MVGCNDYPMIWDRDASEPERREQLEQAIRDYDDDAFLPFTPREVALSSDTGYLECLTWPPPTDLYEPPVPEDAEAPDVPVLVVSGEFDDLTTPWEGRRVAEPLPGLRAFRGPERRPRRRPLLPERLRRRGRSARSFAASSTADRAVHSGEWQTASTLLPSGSSTNAP